MLVNITHCIFNMYFLMLICYINEHLNDVIYRQLIIRGGYNNE